MDAKNTIIIKQAGKAWATLCKHRHHHKKLSAASAYATQFHANAIKIINPARAPYLQSHLPWAKKLDWTLIECRLTFLRSRKKRCRNRTLLSVAPSYFLDSSCIFQGWATQTCKVGALSAFRKRFTNPIQNCCRAGTFSSSWCLSYSQLHCINPWHT